MAEFDSSEKLNMKPIETSSTDVMIGDRATLPDCKQLVEEVKP